MICAGGSMLNSGNNDREQNWLLLSSRVKRAESDWRASVTLGCPRYHNMSPSALKIHLKFVLFHKCCRNLCVMRSICNNLNFPHFLRMPTLICAVYGIMNWKYSPSATSGGTLNSPNSITPQNESAHPIYFGWHEYPTSWEASLWIGIMGAMVYSCSASWACQPLLSKVIRQLVYSINMFLLILITCFNSIHFKTFLEQVKSLVPKRYKSIFVYLRKMQ
jgi:hypothetical protein